MRKLTRSFGFTTLTTLSMLAIACGKSGGSDNANPPSANANGNKTVTKTDTGKDTTKVDTGTKISDQVQVDQGKPTQGDIGQGQQGQQGQYGTSTMVIRFPSKMVAKPGDYIELSESHEAAHRPILERALYSGNILVVPAGTRVDGTLQAAPGGVSQFSANWLTLADNSRLIIDGYAEIATVDKRLSETNWWAVLGTTAGGAAVGALADFLIGGHDINWWAPVAGGAAGAAAGLLFIKDHKDVVVIEENTVATVEFTTDPDQ